MAALWAKARAVGFEEGRRAILEELKGIPLEELQAAIQNMKI